MIVKRKKYSDNNIRFQEWEPRLRNSRYKYIDKKTLKEIEEDFENRTLEESDIENSDLDE